MSANKKSTQPNILIQMGRSVRKYSQRWIVHEERKLTNIEFTHMFTKLTTKSHQERISKKSEGENHSQPCKDQRRTLTNKHHNRIFTKTWCLRTITQAKYLQMVNQMKNSALQIKEKLDTIQRIRSLHSMPRPYHNQRHGSKNTERDHCGTCTVTIERQRMQNMRKNDTPDFDCSAAKNGKGSTCTNLWMTTPGRLP